MDLVDAILSPLGFGLLLAFVLWRLHARMPRCLWRIGIAVEIVCLVLTTPFGAGLLVAFEEARAPSPQSCAAPAPSTIVLLSGGVRRLPRDVHDYGALSNASMRRTIDAARLMRDQPGVQLVISGTRGDEDVHESEVMAALAHELGVPAEAIRVETASLTTWENAERVRALDANIPARIWLVTSALHMPRALIAFRRAGFEACSYPSDYLSSPIEGLGDFLPSGGAVSNAAAALHEMVGEIVYRLR